MNSHAKIQTTLMASDNKNASESIDRINDQLDEQNKKLDLIIDGLATIKEISLDVNKELKQQGKTLKRIDKKLEENTIQVNKNTKTLERIESNMSWCSIL